MAGVAQFLLVVVAVTLTFLITFAAVQVFQILHEIRVSVRKFNQLLDNTHYLSESAAKPIAAMNDFFTEVKDMVSNAETQILEQSADRVIEATDTNPGPRRFFHRAGQALRATIRS